MRKFMRRADVMFALVISLAFVLTSAVGFGAPSTPRPKLVELAALPHASPDSFNLRLTWTAVRDARGNPVSYEWGIHNGPAGELRVASGTTSEVTVTKAFLRPLAGDTTIYSASVVAVDIKGSRSSTARSGYLKVTTPWTAPPPPIITVDTIAYQPGMNDTLTLHAFGRDVTNQNISMVVGDTATICAIKWVNDWGTRPTAPVEWWVDQPNAVALTQKGGGCALMGAISVTALGMPPGPFKVAVRG